MVPKRGGGCVFPYGCSLVKRELLDIVIVHKLHKEIIIVGINILGRLIVKIKIFLLGVPSVKCRFTTLTSS